MSDLTAEKICVFYGSYVSQKVILRNFLSFNLLSFTSNNSFYFSFFVIWLLTLPQQIHNHGHAKVRSYERDQSEYNSK